MYASMLARQQHERSKPKIETLLENYLQSIFELMCTLNEATFKDAQLNTHSPFIRFLAKAHDFYCMASLLHAGEGIADEVAVTLMTHFRAKNKLTVEQKIELTRLSNTSWWQIFIETLAAKPQFYAALDQGTGRRNIPLSAADATVQHLTNRHGILRKFFTCLLPELLLIKPDDKPMFVSPIAEELDLQSIVPASDQAISMAIFQRLGSIILMKLPSIFLAHIDSLENQTLYQYFSSHQINVEYIKVRCNLNFYYQLIPCQNISKGTIVFISDMMQDHHEWRAVAEKFLDNYDILLFDNEGVGKTTFSGHSSSLEMLARNIANLLLFLNIKNPHLIGHGFGGLLALELYKHYIPAKGKLILLNTPFSMFGSFKFKQISTLLTLVQNTSDRKIDDAHTTVFFDEYAELFYSEAFAQDFKAELIELDCTFPKHNFEEARGLDMQWRFYREFAANLERKPLDTYFNGHKKNVLLLYSENDRFIFCPKAMLVRNFFPVAMLPDVGHGVLDEKPLIVVERIREHLGLFPTTSPIEHPVLQRKGSEKLQPNPTGKFLQRTHSSRM